MVKLECNRQFSYEWKTINTSRLQQSRLIWFVIIKVSVNQCFYQTIKSALLLVTWSIHRKCFHILILISQKAEKDDREIIVLLIVIKIS